MPKNPKKYLYDISKSIRIIFDEYLKDINSHEEFEAQTLIQDGVERRLIIIAEALSRLRNHNIHLAAGDKIINRRNTIIHQYDEYSPRKVWLSLFDELPDLKKINR